MNHHFPLSSKLTSTGPPMEHKTLRILMVLLPQSGQSERGPKLYKYLILHCRATRSFSGTSNAVLKLSALLRGKILFRG